MLPSPHSFARHVTADSCRVRTDLARPQVLSLGHTLAPEARHRVLHTREPILPAYELAAS